MATHFKITIITVDAFIELGIFDKKLVKEVFDTEAIPKIQVLDDALFSKFQAIQPEKLKMSLEELQLVLFHLKNSFGKKIMIVEVSLNHQEPVLYILKFIYMLEKINEGMSEEEAKLLAENYTPESHETS